MECAGSVASYRGRGPTQVEADRGPRRLLQLGLRDSQHYRERACPERCAPGEKLPAVLLLSGNLLLTDPAERRSDRSRSPAFRVRDGSVPRAGAIDCAPGRCLRFAMP